MIPLLLSIQIPFTSLQFCNEYIFELDTAVQEQIIAQSEANTLAERCINTYSKGR